MFTDFTVKLTHGTCPAVQLNTANSCTIANNIINSSWGIHLYKANKNDVTNNSILTINGGIIIANRVNVSSQNLIKNNRITNKGNPGLEYNNGIALWNCAIDNTITENYLYNCTNYAIYSEDAGRNTIEKNVIRGNISQKLVGIGLFGYVNPGNIVRQNDIADCICAIQSNGAYFTISGNLLKNNWGGMYLGASPTQMVVRDNVIEGSTEGLRMVYGLDDLIVHNTFRNNNNSLILEVSNRVVVSANNFSGNTWGVVLLNSWFNVFHRNTFMGNDHYVLSYASWDVWLLNYWDQPRLLPKVIVGFLPFVQVDWRPALHPLK